MKIALCGSNGKMGNVFLNTFDQTYTIIAVKHTGTCLNDVIEDVDLVVDFTNGIGAFVHGVIALTHNIPIIIGSTGLSDNQRQTLRKIANNRKIGCILCNNFSYGMVWLKQNLASLHPYFTSIHIEEAHHKSKLDKPSGTALALANKLDIKKENITSIRDDSYEVRHTLFFENEYETFTLKHVVKDRIAYMGMLGKCIEDIGTIHEFIEWE